jgi:hypothetical protein
MNIIELIIEANVASKIKDPGRIKQIAIAMRHDGTLPKAAVAKLGPRPTEQSTLELWSQILDSSLSNTQYGNISQDGKFDDWLTRLYQNGQADYEDINGEGGDALGAWKALSIRGKLKPAHQDFNKFKNLRQIQNIVQSREYRDELRRMKDAEVIEKHKRDRKEIVILDDERFLAVVPMNYGSCYTFNNSHGFQASFCTGSSSGASWFNRYADDGPIVSIFDKQNPDDVNGKWQMHAPTRQLNNGNQQTRGDKEFAERFPGLMINIVAGLEQNAEEINANSAHIVKGGYDMAKAVSDIKKEFPASMTPPEPEKLPEPEAAQNNNGAGVYLVTQTATGRTANITADSLEHAQQQLQQRHPNINIEDFTFELQAENNGQQ